MKIQAGYYLILFTSAVPQGAAWTNVQQSSLPKQVSLKSSTVSSERDIMEGVSAFEQWFSSTPGADCISEVSHSDFGNLRGLSLSSEGQKKWKSSGEELALMTIPKSIVLDSDFSQADWDANLAQKLWIECSKGPSSSIPGYALLLTRGWSPTDLPQLPPPTAPDALRHWSEKEKQLLMDDPVGQRLLNLLEQQNQLWQEKFSRVRGMTFEQFQWAMEVVHSRAFCGNFGAGSSPVSPLVSAAVPVVAAAAGWAHCFQNPDPSDALLVGLGLVAAAPIIFNLVTESPPVAVLLPMIDSINHLEEADSRIEYSPLADEFKLSVGKNCVVNENGKSQLYVSYGKKKDTELLLNYGFIHGVPCEGETSERRKALAEAFLSRQNK
jgi:hypothetical protein